MDRTDVPEAWDERATLTTFLDYARATAVMKTEGLTDEQARIAPLPTSPLMTIAGVVNHLRWVEHSWFEDEFLGGTDQAPWTEEEPDRDFTLATELPLSQVVDEYQQQCAHYRERVAGWDLDTMSARPIGSGPHVTLRWILLHLLEETARHNGHLDVLRELVDGTRGD